MRASIYNAMPIEGVRRLVEYIARVRGEKRLKTGDGPERQLLADSSQLSERRTMPYNQHALHSGSLWRRSIPRRSSGLHPGNP
jgi:hypothetical protein